ncbi:hypothetical protein GN958_ATG03631 [Phytophthora infestans]|nr:hypothetical protein GN958_ATG03631 [Phytophthora infestans]
MQLQRLEKIGDSSVIGTTTTSFPLTRRSLMNAFPNLFYDSTVRSMESRSYRVVQKLLDQHLVMHGSVRFDWDYCTSRIGRIYSEIDMMSSLLELLGNIEDVSFVFKGARRRRTADPLGW